MSYRPVVFDCDGVLVDSELLGWEALGDVLAVFGVDVEESDMAMLAGASYDEDYDHFARRGSLPSRDEFWDLLATRMFELFDQRLEAFEDARDTLEAVAARGVPMAVASNSPRHRLDRSLEATGLGGFFVARVSADDVERPKPAPDIYLRAADLLDVRPGDCVAVEDSPTGIEAAVQAGMHVVAVDRGEFDYSGLSPDVIVPRLTPAAVLVASPDEPLPADG